MNKLILVLFGVVLFLGSCKTNAQRIMIASEQRDCMGVGPQQCLLIREDASQPWEFWYSDIEGFTYEPGFEYTLEVRKENVDNPAADQSSVKYILVKEVSKSSKISDDLPSQ